MNDRKIVSKANLSLDYLNEESEGWNCLEEQLRTEETCKQLRNDVERAELAELGNFYANEDIIDDLSGNATNLEALLPIPCEHVIEIADGRRIRAVACITVRKTEGFEIHEEICSQCGKQLSLHVRHIRGA